METKMTPKVHISIHKEYKLRSKNGISALFIVDPDRKWVNIVFTNSTCSSGNFSKTHTIENARRIWVDAIRFGYTIE